VRAEQLEAQTSRPVLLQAVLRAEASGLPFLIVSPAGEGPRIVVLEDDDERLWVGRSVACDVPLQRDGMASRSHAELVRAGGEWSVADDGLSRNGTFVGGERVTGRRRLRDGDVVSVGESTLSFRAPRSAAAATTLAGNRLPVRPDVTPAQLKVLIALCRPLLADPPEPTPATNRQIAAELYLSEEAVRSHLKTLFGRVAVGDLAQGAKRVRLAEIALQTGLVQRHDVRD
jgi:FHA domain